MIQFAYTILYVPDVTRSAQFYSRAFGFEIKFIAPGNSYAELLTGNTTLSFASTTLARMNLKDGFIESTPANKPFAIETGFTTDNVEAAYNKAIEEGAMAEAAPVQKPHGQTVAYVRDPDGFLIEICTPMG